MRFVFVNNDKEVFDVQKIDSKAFCESLGLMQTPIIKFKNDEESDQEQEEKP